MRDPPQSKSALREDVIFPPTSADFENSVDTELVGNSQAVTFSTKGSRHTVQEVIVRSVQLASAHVVEQKVTGAGLIDLIANRMRRKRLIIERFIISIQTI